METWDVDLAVGVAAGNSFFSCVAKIQILSGIFPLPSGELPQGSQLPAWSACGRGCLAYTCRCGEAQRDLEGCGKRKGSGRTRLEVNQKASNVWLENPILLSTGSQQCKIPLPTDEPACEGEVKFAI